MSWDKTHVIALSVLLTGREGLTLAAGACIKEVRILLGDPAY